MRKIVSLLCRSLLFVGLAAQTPAKANLSLNAPITSVQVYLDRAAITRSAHVDLPAGETVIEFSGLPTRLDESSLRIAGTGSQQVILLGVALRQQFLSGSANPDAKRIEDELTEIDRQESTLTAEKSEIEQRELFLRNLSAGLGRSERGFPNLDEIRQIYVFSVDELKALGDRSVQLQESRQRLETEKVRLKKELEQWNGNKAQNSALVTVQCNQATATDLSLNYSVGDASWMPSYTAQVDSSTGQVNFATRALIRQRTGEDWRSVRVTVSTAHPARNGSLPELTPNYVRFAAPLPAPLPQAAAMAPPPAPTMAEKARAVPVDEEQAELRNTGLSLTYDLPGTQTIPSDGQLHQAVLALRTLQGTPSYVSSPVLTPGAFFKTHVVNTTGAPLLPGKMQVFRDQDLSGATDLKLVPPSSEFDVFCGLDDSVRIERKELVDNRSDVGLINRKQVRRRSYEISVENFRENPITLTLYDHLPVSQEGEINVIPGTFSEKPSSFEKETGKLTWQLTLAAKEKKVLRFDYSIEWPSGKELEEAGG